MRATSSSIADTQPSSTEMNTRAVTDYLPVADAARILGLTPQAVQTRLRRGQMRGIRLHARLWLIPKAEVELWRQLGRQRPGPRPRVSAPRIA